MKKYLNFILILTVLSSCAAKGTNTAASSGSFGDETVKLVKQRKYTIACADAKFMADMLTADNYALVAFMAELASDYMARKSVSSEDKKKIDKYAKVLDQLTGKLEAKYQDNLKVMALVSQNIFDKEINRMIKASMTAYLGLVLKKDFYQFVDITYCGGEQPPGYKSPATITPEAIRTAFDRKFKKNNLTPTPQKRTPSKKK